MTNNCKAPQGETGHHQEVGRCNYCNNCNYGCRTPDDCIQPRFQDVVGEK